MSITNEKEVIGLSPTGAEHYCNKQRIVNAYPDQLKSSLNLKDTNQAIHEISVWPGYEPTPLHPLKNLAMDLGLKQIYYKDESQRFGLGSFKALGGAYGVLRFLCNKVAEELKEDIKIEDLRKGKYAELTQRYTVVTATDGNHGRSVAYGAKLFGCRCQIYIHAKVSMGRKKAMEDLGAEVIRVDGNYDDSLRASIEDAEKHNWQIISDTSYHGYTEYPRHIMAGYTILAEEIADQLSEKTQPTHIFLQAGVGGFAASMCAYFWEKFGHQNIKFVVVEPKLAPCLIESAKAGQLKIFDIKEETMMAGLSCGEPSLLAWNILNKGADHFMTVSDDMVPTVMRLMANGAGGNTAIEAGESAVGGLIGLLEIAQDEKIKKQLALNSDSVILLFGTEGATDPDIYNAITKEI
ncbi:MAG: diaminopropionate ammonia-lyase [Woeseia sp.]|nr:diaminopropionate ammonia-lyase [Woeseia sp.]|tara:strand:+ start:1177 stop:2400 length:1224 start_codon:yes stop_codon:yes gene_type:complete